MKDEVLISNCGRENDVVAYIYDELDAVEKTSFRSHMQDCRTCRAEVGQFNNIHESVVDWRNEALGGVSSAAVRPTDFVRNEAARPSALTALREFFNLSPLWMKGALAFTSVLFCLLAVLAVAKLREAPKPVVAENPGTRKYSEQELRQAVDQRVQDELRKIRNSTPSPAPVAFTPSQVSPKRAQRRTVEVAFKDPQQKARRPLSRVERLQLAADLRLIEDPTEAQLDLLDDRINQ
jgi:hypothetical protein